MKNLFTSRTSAVVSLSLLLGAGSSTVLADNVTSVERLSGPVASEVEAYAAAAERFSDRMAEFREEVEQQVEALRQSQLAELTEGFDNRLLELRDQQEQRRRLAIMRFEGFRRKYPAAEYTPHVMYRLAQLYFQQAEERYILDGAEYERIELMQAEDNTIELPPFPQKDYSASIAIYREIVEDFPDYAFIEGALYMLGFCYTELAVGLSDPDDDVRQVELFDQATAVFQQLVDEHPDSRAAIEANFRLGNRYFLLADVDMAIEYFSRVVDAGPDDPQYDDGLYWLAWSYYRNNSREEGLNYFAQLKDFDQVNFMESGETTSYAESSQYMALTFTEIANDELSHPVQVAEQFFARIGPREWEQEVYTELAKQLDKYDEHWWAIDAYAYIQDRWPLDSMNPDYQREIALLYEKIGRAAPQGAAAQALAELADNYSDGTPWWEANRSNPDALAHARDYILQSLSRVAQELHVQAQDVEAEFKNGTATSDEMRQAYSRAADRYHDFLNSDPFVNEYEKNQWLFADALFKAGRYDEALAEFESLISKDGHDYQQAAMWMLLQARRQLMVNTYGAEYGGPDSSASVVASVEKADGTMRDQYELSEEYMAFIEACDLVKDQTFERGGEWDELADALDRNRGSLHYNAARILYEHGLYDEARPRLETLIDLFPRTNEAAKAANVLVNTYLQEGDLETVRELLVRFTENPLGEDPELIATTTEEFEQRLERTIYNLALNLVRDGKPEESALAFLEFIEEFPDSEDVDEALYSAAINYNNAGKATEANELFERFIEQYPTDPHSEELTFSIAENARDVLQFEKALDYYGRVLRYFGDGDYIEEALYNSADLLVGIGDNRGAAEALENFARRFPDDREIEAIHWLAGEQWKLVGEREALSFYQGYLRNRAGINPSHTLQAMNWMAEYYDGRGDTRRADSSRQELLESYHQFAESGEVGSAGRHMAALIAVAPILETHAQLVEIDYPDGMQELTEYLGNKVAELNAFEPQAMEIFSTYSDFEVTSQVFYLIGTAYAAMANMYFRAPVPDGLPDSVEERFRTGMQSGAAPLLESALQRLDAVVNLSESQGFSSEWVDLALALRADLKPSDYSAEKRETFGVAATQYVPTAPPRSQSFQIDGDEEGEE
jgi:cellulose synthase operon protein C